MAINKETIIISLGGSLVVPDNIDIEFLKNFKKVLQKYFKKFNFVILVGGGKVCRNYQKALSEFKVEYEQKDWIGIYVSRLNAELVKNIFGKDADKKIITNPTKKIKTNKKVIVGAGWKPGWSTDYVSVLVSKTYGVKTIINLTNIDYVYDLPALPTGQAGGRQAKIPADFENAKPFKNINWKDFQKIVGTKWTPGLSAPFDPRASLLAGKNKMKVVIINGKNLERLESFLNSKPFIGTIIN
jgi:uridylate kinase